MDVILVCHTELGFVSGKTLIGDKKATKGVSEGSLELARIAEGYGAKVTFCVCPEVAPYFPKNLNHEIGLHIHPGQEELTYAGHTWIVGDEYLKKHCTQSSNSTALRDFSYEEQLGMIKTGKEYVEGVFGLPINVFAAGRWSVNNDTVKALLATGFTHDLSGPAHSISDHYDWLKLPRICPPYHPAKNDYQEKGDLPITMVPVSQTLFGGTVSLEGEIVYGLPWLKACFEEYYRAGVPLFHIAIHSPALTSPYYKAIMEKFLAFAAAHKNVNFKVASEVKEYPVTKFKSTLTPYVSGINATFLTTALRRVLGIKSIYR